MLSEAGTDFLLSEAIAVPVSPVEAIHDVFHTIGDVRELNGAISAVSMAHRTNDYRGHKLPAVFSLGLTMVVEHNSPHRIADGHWIMSHDEVCDAHGIPITVFDKSTNAYLTSGYMFRFRADPIGHRYYFPSTARYLTKKHVSLFRDRGITVVDEHYRVYEARQTVSGNTYVKRYATCFTPEEYHDLQKF